MAQVDRAEQIKSSRGGIYNQYNETEEVATTASFVTALDVDCVPIRESLFIIHNNAGGDLDYQILGNVRHLDDIVAPSGTNDDDKGWIVIASASIATTVAPDEVVVTKNYTQIVVQIKHTTATTNVDIWHRGEN